MTLIYTVLLSVICTTAFAAVVGSFVVSYQIIRDMGER